MNSWLRGKSLVVLIAAALLLAAGAVALLHRFPDYAPATEAVAGVAAALLTAVAATSASDAARESRVAANLARKSLYLHERPELRAALEGAVGEVPRIRCATDASLNRPESKPQWRQGEGSVVVHWKPVGRRWRSATVPANGGPALPLTGLVFEEGPPSSPEPQVAVDGFWMELTDPDGRSWVQRQAVNEQVLGTMVGGSHLEPQV